MYHRQDTALSARPSPAGNLLRLWPLIGLLALALFPFGWLGQLWPAFGHILFHIFATDVQHEVGHTLIFCLIGGALLYSFPTLLARPRRYFGLMLLASLAQEGFQLLYKQRPLAFDDARDIVVDLLAYLAVFAVAWGWRRLRGGSAGLEQR